MPRFVYRLDAEGFVEFRKQWADSGEAGKRMVDELLAKFPQLGDESEKQQARIAAARKRMEDDARSSFQSLQGNLDPVIAAQQSLARGRETVTKAQVLGVTTDVEAAAALRQLEQRYGSATAGVSLFSQGLGTVKGALGAFGIAVGLGELVSFGKHIEDNAAQLINQAKKTNVAVEALQAYRAALEDNGSSAERADLFIARFNERIGEAKDGSAEARKAFTDAGLGAADLGGKVEDAWDKWVRALAAEEDGSKRAALARAMLGREGKEILAALPALAEGTDHLTQLYKEQSRIVGYDLAKAAKDSADAQTVAWSKVSVALTPVSVATASLLTTLLRIGSEGVVLISSGAERQLSAVENRIRDLERKISDAQRAPDIFGDKGDAVARLQKQLDEAKAQLGLLKITPADTAVNEPGTPSYTAPSRGMASWDSTALSDYIAKLQEEARLAGLSAEAADRERAIDEALKVKRDALKDATAQLTDEERRAVVAAVALKQAHIEATQAAKDSADALASTDALINRLANDYEERSKKAKDDTVKANEEAVASTEALINKLANEYQVEKTARDARKADYKDYLDQLGQELQFAYLTSEERRVETEVIRARNRAKQDGQPFDEAAIRAQLTLIQATEKWTGVLTDIRGSMKSFWMDWVTTGHFSTKGLFDTIKSDFASMLYDMVIEAQLRPIMLNIVGSIEGGIGAIGDLVGGNGSILSGVNALPSLVGGSNANAANDNQYPFPSSVQVTTQIAGSNPGGFLTTGSGVGGYIGAGAVGYGVGSMNLFGGNAQNSEVGGSLGALAGMALTPILGPLGPIVGAFLGSAAGSLFGPGPSNYTATAQFNAGQTGATFSGDKPNQNTTSLAQSTAQAILSELANLRGYGVGFSDTLSSISIGQRDRSSYVLGSGAKGTTGTVGDAGDLALGAIQALLRSSSSTSPTLQAVLSTNKFASLTDLDAAAKFVTQVYDVVVAAKPAATQTETAMKNLIASFKDASTQAKALGLDVNALAAGAKKSFDQDIRGAILQIQDPLKNALELWQRDAQARLDAAAQLGGDIGQVQQLNALLRQQAVDQATSGLKTGLQSLIDSLNFGPSSANAPDKQYFAALQDYNAARTTALSSGTAADIGSFQSAAQSFLPIARGFLGTSQRYGAYTDEVIGTANSLMSRLTAGAAPDLTPVVQATNSGSAAIVDAVNENKAAIDLLNTKVDALNGLLGAFARRVSSS